MHFLEGYEEKCNSIEINTLRAKEETKFKQFLSQYLKEYFQDQIFSS